MMKDENNNDVTRSYPTRVVGSGTPNHFFGYYNKSTWSQDGRFFLSNRVQQMTGDLTGKEIATVGYFDLENDDRFHEIGQTSAWNWQMGCQLQWLGQRDQRRIIYNAHAEDYQGVYPEFCSIVHNMESGENRTLPLPVYVVSPDGDYALCVDYSRFQVTHETIGYSALKGEPVLENAPADDGIHIMDIETGESKQLLSLAELTDYQPVASMDNAIHWVTHLELSPNGKRFLFIHRWTERVEDETCFLHRLFTCGVDGAELCLLECTDHPLPQLEEGFDPNAAGTFDYEKSEYQISHPAWKDDESVIAWAPHKGSIHYHLYDERTGAASIVGEGILDENGHMTYSRDGRWLLTDTYPDSASNERDLIIFDVETSNRYIIGRFYTPPDLGKHNRCDLHPRWESACRQVSIDSVHEGTRQQYIIDVSEVVS